MRTLINTFMICYFAIGYQLLQHFYPNADDL